MPNAGTINIDTKVDVRGLKTGLSQTQKQIVKFVRKIPLVGKAFSRAAAVGLRSMNILKAGVVSLGATITGFISSTLAPLIALLGPAALLASVAKGISLFREQEQAVAGLNNALANTISLTSETALTSEELESRVRAASAEMQEFASALQRVTTFGDEAIIGVSTIISSLGKLEGEALKDATRATLNFATTFGIDLKAAGQLVAKTLASSTNALTRYGIEVEGAVGSSERLQAVLEGINRATGDSAEAIAKTLTGRLQQLQNAFGDLLEQVGRASLQLLDFAATGESATDKILDFADAINRATETAEFEELVTVIKSAIDAVKDLFDASIDLALTMFNVSRETNRTSGLLFILQKTVQGVTAVFQGLTILLNVVEIGFNSLVAAISFFASVMVSQLNIAYKVAANTLGTTIKLARIAAKALGKELPDVVENFGNSIDGVSDKVDQLERDLKTKTVTSVAKSGDAFLRASRNGEKLRRTLSDFVGVTTPARTEIRQFELGLTGTAGALAKTTDETESNTAAVKANESAVKASNEAMKERNKLIEAALKLANRFTEATAASAIKAKEDLALLRARNLADLEKDEIIKNDLNRKAELIAVNNQVAQSERALAESAEELINKTRELRNEPPDFNVVDIDQAIEELNRLGISYAGVPDLIQQLEERRSQISQAAALERIKIEQDAIDKEKELRRNKIEEDFRNELDGIRNRSQAALTELDLQERQELQKAGANQIEKLKIEEDFQRRRYEIIRNAEVQISQLANDSANQIAVLDQARLDALQASSLQSREAYTGVEGARIEAERAVNEQILAQRQDFLDKTVGLLVDSIDTSLFTVEDGQIRLNDILEGSSEKILESIVNVANNGFNQWLQGLTQVTDQTAEASDKITGSFAQTGGQLQGIFSGLFGSGGQGGSLLSGVGGFVSSLTSSLSAALGPIGLLATGFSLFKSFSDRKKKEREVSKVSAGIKSTGSGIFNATVLDNVQQQSVSRVSTARRTVSAQQTPSFVQNVSVPVNVTIDTDNGDIVGQVKAAFETEVIPKVEAKMKEAKRKEDLLQMSQPRRTFKPA